MSSSKNKSLIKYSGNVLARTEKSIEIVNKLLVKDIDELLSLFGEYIGGLVMAISAYSPLTYEILDKYENFLDWKKISENTSILWSKKIYDRFHDKLIFLSLNCNKSFVSNHELFFHHLNNADEHSKANRESYYSFEESWGFIFLDYPLNSENLLNNYIDILNRRFKNHNSIVDWCALNLSFLSEEWIHRNQEKIDFESFSWNESLPWSKELIEQHEDRWNWEALSANSSLPWSETLIEKYEDKWDWEALSYSISFPLTQELIIKFEDDSLSYDESLPWTQDLIDNYKDKWDWEALSANSSLPWSRELINLYRIKLNWDKFPQNTLIPLSKKFWRQHHFLLKPKTLASNRSKAFPWNELFDEIHKKTFQYHPTQDQGFQFWEELCRNPSIPWSLEMIEKINGRTNYRLSSLPLIEESVYSEELSQDYYDRWDFEELWALLSKNISLPWSEELIDKYIDRWDWRALSINESIPWTEELIIKYKDNINWNPFDYKRIYECESITWTIELLQELKLMLGFFLSKKVYNEVFKSYLNEANIEYILKLVSSDSDGVESFPDW
jgi:hypothetical protein